MDLYKHDISRQFAVKNQETFFDRTPAKQDFPAMWVSFLNDQTIISRTDQYFFNSKRNPNILKYMAKTLNKKKIYYMAYTNVINSDTIHRFVQAIWEFDSQKEANKYMHDMLNFGKETPNTHVVKLNKIFDGISALIDPYFASDAKVYLDKMLSLRQTLKPIERGVIVAAKDLLPENEAVVFMTCCFKYNATLNDAKRNHRILSTDEYVRMLHFYNKAQALLD